MGELTTSAAVKLSSSNLAVTAKNGSSASASAPAALDPVDRLILSWLVRCGFERSFAQMPAATVYADPNTASLPTRASKNEPRNVFLRSRFLVELMALIKNGSIADAVAYFRANFPLMTMQTPANSDSRCDLDASDSSLSFTLDSDSSLALLDLPSTLRSASSLTSFQCYFLLLLQQMIEMMRIGDLPAVLDFINTELVPLAVPSGLAHAWLQDALGLLAYADPLSSPLSGLLDKARWLWLAELLNCAICIRTSSSSDALETVLKQVIAIDGLVHETDAFAPDEQAVKKWRDLQACFTGTSIFPPSLADPRPNKTIKRD